MITVGEINNELTRLFSFSAMHTLAIDLPEGGFKIYVDEEPACIINPDVDELAGPMAAFSAKYLRPLCAEPPPYEDFGGGDVVRLLSGGPKMSVIYEDEGLVYCVWVHKGKPREHLFPAWCLVSAQD